MSYSKRYIQEEIDRINWDIQCNKDAISQDRLEIRECKQEIKKLHKQKRRWQIKLSIKNAEEMEEE